MMEVYEPKVDRNELRVLTHLFLEREGSDPDGTPWREYEAHNLAMTGDVRALYFLLERVKMPDDGIPLEHYDFAIERLVGEDERYYEEARAVLTKVVEKGGRAAEKARKVLRLIEGGRR
jgi:hypothetical protein